VLAFQTVSTPNLGANGMKRKCLLVVTLGVLALPATGWAQNRGDVSAIVGWQWGGGINTREGRIVLDPAVNYGVEIDLVARPGAEIVLLYNRQDTEARLTNRGIGLPDTSLAGVAVNYFQIGGVAAPYRHGAAKPFLGATLGLTWFDPKTSNVSSQWRFSGSLGGGLKVLPTPRIGLRAQFRWWFTFIPTGSSWWCGVPGGCWATTTFELISQGEVSGGLVIRF
jgi:hypothetical protein